MKAEFILKVVIPPFIIFAILVWLTAEHYISGWVMYLLWVIGFVVANIIVTKISTRWSIQRMREKRAKEEKNNDKVAIEGVVNCTDANCNRDSPVCS